MGLGAFIFLENRVGNDIDGLDDLIFSGVYIKKHPSLEGCFFFVEDAARK
jgi:hypothetical protein